MPSQVGPAGGGGSGGGSASGTTNSVAKFTSSTGLGNSRITDDGTDIVADSGTGTFEAGDAEFIGNGCQVEVDDAANKIYLQANGNGNFIQTLTLDGGDSGRAQLLAQGTGGTVSLNLDAGLATVTLNSGEGVFSAGDTGPVGNGTLIRATDNPSSIELKAPNATISITATTFEPVVAGTTTLGSDGTEWSRLFLYSTITPSGTTGAQTINRAAGSVNFAAAATSLVVTCNMCTENSLVFAVVATNDATATIKNVVPANGSFTIRLTAGATAETRVSFWVLN